MAELEFLNPYDTQKLLAGVIPANQPIRANWLQSFFTDVRTSEEKTINFDKEFATDNVMGMYVSPDLDATPIMLPEMGHKEVSFAYTKEALNSPDYEEVSTRRLGKALNTKVNVQANIIANIRAKLAIAEQRIESLFELNARNIIFDGTHKAVSEKHPEVWYDYGRTKPTSPANAEAVYQTGYAPELNLATLAGNGGVGKRAWNSTGGTKDPTPVKDLIMMVQTADRKSGVDKVIMSGDAFEAFQKDVQTNYKDAADLTLLVQQRVALQVLPEISNYKGVTLRMTFPIGQSRTVDIYTYEGTYKDRMTGVETKYVPDGYVVCVPNGGLGLKVYGRIMHPRANYSAQPRWINFWENAKTGKREWEVHSSYVMGHMDMDSVVSWKVML